LGANALIWRKNRVSFLRQTAQQSVPR